MSGYIRVFEVSVLLSLILGYLEDTWPLFTSLTGKIHQLTLNNAVQLEFKRRYRFPILPKLEICKELRHYSTYNTSFRFQGYDDMIRAFERACTYGHLEICKYIHFEYTLTKKSVKFRDNTIFRLTAQEGQLNILKWLTKTFGITSEDVTCGMNISFQMAAMNGHLHVLKWLAGRFNLHVDCFNWWITLSFRYATRHGHVEVCDWLTETFGVTA